MGCTASHLFDDDNDDDNDNVCGHHHIVSLTSTTYGLLALDSPQRRSTSEPEVINTWELMAGLDNNDSFRFSPRPNSNKENHNLPSRHRSSSAAAVLRPANSEPAPTTLEAFEPRCPPGGENDVVVYTTSLRGIRKTFEDCSSVRAVLQSAGVWVRERDVSMHSGFREELRELIRGRAKACATPPRVFVRGRYIGGAEEVLRIHEDGTLAKLVEGLPRSRPGAVCGRCGGARFLPCFRCHGSCKIRDVAEDSGERKVVRCFDCNENGLIVCVLCT